MTDTRQLGFTLLELLIVIVLVGVVVTFAQLSMGSVSVERQIDQESKRLMGLIDQLSEEAILHGAVMGIQFTRYSYSFHVRKEGEWEAHSGTLFRTRELPGRVEFTLALGGMPVSLPVRGEGRSRIEPQIVLYPSGERSPFELSFRHDGNNKMTLEGPLMGDVSRIDPGEHK